MRRFKFLLILGKLRISAVSILKNQLDHYFSEIGKNSLFQPATFLDRHDIACTNLSSLATGVPSKQFFTAAGIAYDPHRNTIRNTIHLG